MDKAEQPTTQSLKPCPFCGGEAELRENGYQVHCATGCTANVNDDYAPEAIAAWNTRTTSLAAQDGLVEALDDATIDEIILNFAGGVVQVPSEHNPRGYVSYYRPREAMRKALSAIKEQHHD